MSEIAFQFVEDKSENEMKNLSIYANTFDKITFITENIKSVPTSKIKLLDKNINRTETKSKIAALLKDIEASVLIEAGIFEFTLVYCSMKNYIDEMFIAVYNDKVYDLLQNFDSESRVGNTSLVNSLVSGEVNPQVIAFMKPQDLHPERWESVKKKIELREYKKKNMAVTDMYECRRCKERRCRISERQGRSADEGVDKVVECMNCGHIMKFRS